WLDQATKDQIENLAAEHDALFFFCQFLKGSPEERANESARIAQEHPTRVHPVVRIHPETGERMLFVNAFFTQRIVGLSADESASLLSRLYAQFALPEYQVRFKWRPN